MAKACLLGETCRGYWIGPASTIPGGNTTLAESGSSCGQMDGVYERSSRRVGSEHRGYRPRLGASCSGSSQDATSAGWTSCTPERSGVGSSVWESSTDGLLIASLQQGGRGGFLAPSLGELEGLRRLPWVVDVTGSESRFRFSTGQGRVYRWTKPRRS